METRTKVVGVISSADRNGNSATLLREALAGAREAGGVETEEIFLPELGLEFCRGCLRCSREGRCHLPDGFEDVRAKLAAADGIILSSPTFGAAPCAMMKNMMDRLGLFEYMTSSVFGGKYVAAISTAKSFGADKTAKDMAGLPLATVFQRAYVSGTLGAILKGGVTAAESPKHLAKARALGRRVAEDHRVGRTYPLQNLWPRLMNLMIRPAMAKGVADYKDTDMRGVYDNLVERGLIA